MDDLVVLRERFGMNYRDAYLVEPVWYVDLLLDRHRAEQHALLVAQDEAAARAEMEAAHAQKLQDLGIA